MKRTFRPWAVWAALAASGLLLLAGCGDKHEPTKPTVISDAIRTLLPAF